MSVGSASTTYSGTVTRGVTAESTHSVTFEPGPGASWSSVSGTNPLTVNDGDKVPAAPSIVGLVPPSGYRQTGWEYASSHNGARVGDFLFGPSGTAVTSDLYVRPVWGRASYSISYDWNGGSWAGGSLPASAVYGDTVNAPASAGARAPAHHHLDYWEYKTPSGSWTAFTGSFAMPADNVSIRPVWAESTHSVTFEPGPGASWSSVSGTNPLTVNDGDKVPAAPSIVGLVPPSGYRQTGWEYASSHNGARVGDFLFGPSGTAVTSDLYVRPVWGRASYSISYDWNGGSWAGGSLPASAVYGDTVNAPASAGARAPAHHHLDYWEYKTPSGSWTAFTGSFAMPADNVSIRPVWAESTHSVTFEPGPGASWSSVSGTNPLTVNDGDKVPAAPSIVGLVPPSGYRQTGWEYASSHNGARVGDFLFGPSGTAVTSDLYVRPVWGRASYSISYDWNGGSWAGGSLPASAVYGDTVNAPASAGARAPAHHHLDYWEYKTPSGSWTAFTGSFAMPADNVSIRPVWAESTHSVTFEPGPGASWSSVSGTNPLTVNDGDKVPAAPSIVGLVPPSGYRQTGWEYASSHNGARVGDFLFGPSGTAVTSDLYVRPVWGRASYSISYDWNGGSWAGGSLPASAVYGDTVNAPASAGARAPAHHHLDYWEYKTPSGSWTAFTGSFAMPADNVSIRPVWAESTHSVTFEPGPGASWSSVSGTNPLTVNDGDKVPAAPSIVGWCLRLAIARPAGSMRRRTTARGSAISCSARRAPR
ncbi:hypothetical protein OZX73_00625 [Bifidobacterium sp. ESL0775]|uniref:hypothetical protein n=1 Tax=Bifidobacterium sp. ESL0775 TaxID=2983230 RepID=UPI0023F7C263|nr:hypothetical protein [Bifidobacterium sp. ESL0775]WEV69436.1 hypothetical protein OZX73_00625 [Bifidobacterium sp. ESL0775]